MIIDSEATPTIGALARYRHTVLSRANELLDASSPIPLAERLDALPALTGMLMTSLEELKVAEEELREQNAVLAARQAAEDARTFHYTQLFLQAPRPVLITDRYATILEANLAAATMFRRESRHLERKPLSALIDKSMRDEFRRQVTRLEGGGDITDWRLTLHRLGDVPVTVHATVKVISSLGATASGVLYWLLDTAPVAR